MSFDDFKANFTRLEICFLGPDTLLDDDDEDFAEYARRWEGELMEGSWRRFVNAGGCPNFPGRERLHHTFSKISNNFFYLIFFCCKNHK